MVFFLDTLNFNCQLHNNFVRFFFGIENSFGLQLLYQKQQQNDELVLDFFHVNDSVVVQFLTLR
ncbi:hypothetical protein FSS13T_26440 [Flavobacterium saliperosum S13]|uniref:Uncharacterized protein n=1 Tax=Flavobacterium saliperosum S13 TaxID=1341155 RepID=A0ABP2ZU80_9FLAO|nr:hypothetical protein FSS13T_26440 [Flavobacterium saliperosum S13]